MFRRFAFADAARHQKPRNCGGELGIFQADEDSEINSAAKAIDDSRVGIF